MLINRLRFDRAYGRLHDEEGLSLVELMVAILVLGIVLSGLASTIVTSLRAITKNQREARAVALQTEMLERFQAIPWDEVGLHYTDTNSNDECDPGEHPWDADGNGLDDELGNEVTAPPDEQTPVVCVDPSEVARFIPSAVETRGEGDLEYRIESHVVFVSRDSEPPSDIDDYETKRIVVFVSWEDTDGSERTIETAAERSPPVKALGFVDPDDDRDLDNIPDDDDNCPDTRNQDQADNFPEDGVGDACDPDRDGITSDNDGEGPDNCPNDANPNQEDRDGDGIGDACDPEPDVPQDPPEIQNVTIWKQQGSSWTLTGLFCVDRNDALSKDHRIRVEVANLPQGSGSVEVTYFYWAGEQDVSPPPDQRSGTASAAAGGSDASTFYDLIVAQNTGKFRDEYDTRVEATATSSGGQSDSYPDHSGFTVAIDRC